LSAYLKQVGEEIDDGRPDRKRTRKSSPR